MSGARPSLCIVNYNGARHLRRSLPAAWRLRDRFAEILLVDDASTDDGPAWVAAHYPEVRILRQPENRGPGAARNAGIAAAVSDRILFIDNDVSLQPGCVEALSAALDAHPEAAAAQATVLYADRPEIVQYSGASAHYLGMMIPEFTDRSIAEVPAGVRSCGSLVTCCFMVDRRRLGDVRFDEDIFIYFDDHEFGLTLRERGHALLAVGEARVLHGEGTEGMSIRALGTYSERRVFQTIRNRWLVLAKHYPGGTLAVLAPALLLFEAAQFAMALRRGWLGPWRRAVAWIWRHRRALARKRVGTLAHQRVPLGRLLQGGPLPLRPEVAATGFERWLIRGLDRIFAVYWRLVAPLLSASSASSRSNH